MSHWYDSTPKKSRRKLDSNPGSSALEADALPLGQRGGITIVNVVFPVNFMLLLSGAFCVSLSSATCVSWIKE